jgi:3-phenylpropionate/cinnamic acid dioxygenase small subunit
MRETSERIAPGAARYAEALEFLHREAELLDTGEFAAWLELLTADVAYSMPVRLNTDRRGQSPYPQETEIFAENLASLRVRVNQLTTDFAWAESPASRTRHFVTNVRVYATAVPEELAVRSYVLVYRSQGTQTTADLFAGERDDLLRQVAGAWRLARRTIYLDQAVVGATHLAIFF